MVVRRAVPVPGRPGYEHAEYGRGTDVQREVLGGRSRTKALEFAGRRYCRPITMPD